MRREVDDPRGWRTLDWDRESEERAAAGCAAFPFLPLSADALAQKLSPVDLESATRLLGIATYEWGRVAPWDTATDALADARTVLSRFGSEVLFFSNITAARLSASPDLTTGVGGWTSLTEYVGDAGFVAVTPQEVCVFWSFWPI
jgi:hypothetical protein